MPASGAVKHSWPCSPASTAGAFSLCTGWDCLVVGSAYTINTMLVKLSWCQLGAGFLRCAVEVMPALHALRLITSPTAANTANSLRVARVLRVLRTAAERQLHTEVIEFVVVAALAKSP